MNWLDKWKKQMKSSGFKYFVLKIDDFLNALGQYEGQKFNEFLDIYNIYREKLGKAESKYWVVNRDDVPHIKTWEEFAKCINYKENDK